MVAEVAVAQTVDLSANSVTLVWPAAQDNVAITRYVVQVDGEPPFELDANARSATFGELLPWQSLVNSPCRGCGRTTKSDSGDRNFYSDTEAPTWHTGQSLVPSQIEVHSVDGGVGQWPSMTQA